MSLLFLGGCGSNRPSAPADWVPGESCLALAYPEGPYGTEPGSVIANACFRGWRSPSSVAHEEATLEPIALSDFYDPDGSHGVRLLLINTAAIWCSACRIEHETLPEHDRELRQRGLAVLSALFQDQARNPATVEDLAAWVEAFGTTFPMVIDPDYQLGLYASAETAPLNLIVDPRTMRIVWKFIGDQSAVIWPFVEAELADPE
jgi:hypothetical protein